MAGEISLREYVDVRFEAQEKAVQAALDSAQRAVSKAEAASEKRFESVNEFRSALGDSARLLMPRSEAEQAFKTMNDKIDLITSRVNAREEQGKGLSQGWVFLISAVSLAGAIFGMVAFFARPG